MTQSIKNGILIFLIFPLIIVSSIITKDLMSATFGFNESTGKLLDSITVLALSISTLLGIVCGYIYQHIHEIREKESLEKKSFLKSLFTSSDLWKSLVASPIICGVVIATNRNNPDLLMAIIFAFENGFFSKIVFSFEKKK